MPVSRAVRRRIKIKLEKAILEAVKNNGERIYDYSQVVREGDLGIPYATGQLKSTGQFEKKSWGWMLKYGGNSGGKTGKGAPYAVRLHEGVSGGPIQVQPYIRAVKVDKNTERLAQGLKPKRGKAAWKTVNKKVAGYTTTPKQRKARPWVSQAVDARMPLLIKDLFEALQKQFRARGGSIKGGK